LKRRFAHIHQRLVIQWEFQKYMQYAHQPTGQPKPEDRASSGSIHLMPFDDGRRSACPEHVTQRVAAAVRQSQCETREHHQGQPPAARQIPAGEVFAIVKP
jgi:hypothetical protein